MAIIIQHIVNGIIVGSIYALMAIGFAMVFSLLGLINFSHGQIFMLGGFIALFVTRYISGNLFIVLFLTLALISVVGIGVEKIAIRPLRDRKAARASSLITTLGVGIFIENMVIVIYGADHQSFRPPFPVRFFNVHGVFISSLDIIIIVITLLLLVLISLLMYKTKYGAVIRACSQDFEATSLMGVNVNRIIAGVFAIGSMLAALGGILIGYYFNSVDPGMGTIVGMKGFTASVLGGTGMISGAVVGGIVLGMLESIGAAIFTAQFRDIIAFTALILILLFKPEGLLGKKGG